LGLHGRGGLMVQYPHLHKGRKGQSEPRHGKIQRGTAGVQKWYLDVPPSKRGIQMPGGRAEGNRGERLSKTI